MLVVPHVHVRQVLLHRLGEVEDGVPLQVATAPQEVLEMGKNRVKYDGSKSRSTCAYDIFLSP